jgi:hypothetical protein
MKTWSFADASTGLFTGVTFSSCAPSNKQAAVLAANTREGWIAVEGTHDHLSQRLDLATGKVVNDADLARRNADAAEREQRRTLALARIRELEFKQLRPMRELATDPDSDMALGVLAEIDAEIAQLRAQL